MSRDAAAERKTELPELYVNSARLQFGHGNSMLDQMFVPRRPRMRMVPFQFIKPAVPRLRERPPEGEGWLHEVKFDGWRVQLHKVGREIIVFSRNGHDITKRCRWIDEASSISARSVIIDGELVALGVDGRPDFDAMGRRGIATTLCAFDLLELNGRDMRALPLVERRRRLKRLSAAVPTHMLFSETFADPFALLVELEKMEIEGIVSKRANASYRSGTACGWVKVKTESWRRRHGERWRQFTK